MRSVKIWSISYLLRQIWPWCTHQCRRIWRQRVRRLVLAPGAVQTQEVSCSFLQQFCTWLRLWPLDCKIIKTHPKLNTGWLLFSKISPCIIHKCEKCSFQKLHDNQRAFDPDQRNPGLVEKNWVTIKYLFTLGQHLGNTTDPSSTA